MTPAGRGLKGLGACAGKGALLALLLGACLPALAQDFSLTQIEARPTGADDIYLGPSVFTAPRFPGAARHDRYVLPLVEAFGTSGWFASTIAGLGWNFSADKTWQYGYRLTPMFPRYARQTTYPQQVPDIGPRVEQGLFLNYAPWEFLSLQTGVRHGAGQRSAGTLADAGLVLGVPLFKPLTLAASASTSWANAAYTRSYFGIPGQYTPGDGFVNVNTDVMLLADLSARWSLTLDWGWIRYRGPARASPLLEASRPQTVYAGLEYHF